MLVGTIHGRVSQNPQILLSAVSGRNVCSFYCCSTDTANLAASDHSDIAQGGETLSSEGSWPSSFYLKETHVNPLKTKRRLLYLKAQFVPRSKHFSSRL